MMITQSLDLFLHAASSDHTFIYHIDGMVLVLTNAANKTDVLRTYLPKPPDLTEKILSADMIPSVLVVVLDGEMVSTQDCITMPSSLWQQVLILPSVADILAYLTALYWDDDLMPQAFLRSPSYYQRAWRVQKKLQQMDFMARVDPLIKEAVYKKQDSLDFLATRQPLLSGFWDKAVWRWLANNSAAKSKAIAKALLIQCGYTRLKIIEFILAYSDANVQQKQAGLLSYEHSYHRFGSQFVLVIYGLDKSSELHKDYIATHYQDILSHIKNQIISNELKELFLLGFDLSQKDDEGNYQVLMDVYDDISPNLN